MRHLLALAFFAAMLMLGFALTACSDDSASNDYYENNVHHGYPGPGTQTPGY
jgi:hypothetical protein